MSRTPRWIVHEFAGLVLVGALVASCSAERAAPLPTRPQGPAATVVTTDAGEEVEEVDAVVEVAEVAEVAGPSVPAQAPDAAVDSTTATSTTATSTTTTLPAPISDATWQEFDAQLAVRLLGNGDYTASVAIAVNGEIVHTGAYGARAPAVPPIAGGAPTTTAVLPTPTTPRPPTEDVEVTDRFRIASISKIVTAIVVLQLVEGGDLALDEPVGADLAAALGATIVEPAIATITVRQLLSHTSGLNAYEGTFFGGRVASCREAGGRGLSGGLDAPPGSAYRYSNMNYCLLGVLIEQVTGDDYETAVDDRLLAPMGITGMRLAGTFDAAPDEVQHPSVADRNYMETLGAAGAWVASAEDIVTIVGSLDPSTPGWQPLADRTLGQMRRPVAGATYPRAAERWYGLGLIVFADGTWGHTGTIENTHSMVLHRPDGVTWCVLVNGEYPSDTSDLRRIFDESVAAAELPLG